MFDEVNDFRSFYQTSLGRRTASAMRQHIKAFWRGPSSLVGAFIGYGLPFVEKGQRPVGLMPARRGVVVWPSVGPVRACLVDPHALPIPDVQLDRLLLVHALEFESNPGDLLDECWRVLDGSGRILLAVPNRRGMWARREGTPLGNGQPYSGRQLRLLLERHGFTPRKTVYAVFIPPIKNHVILRFTPVIERIGSKWWPAIGGVLLVEAEKMLYAPSGIKREKRARIKAKPMLVGQASGSVLPKA
jgi:SAM-dependent methyltransferase